MNEPPHTQPCASLPWRMTTVEVCTLARVSRATLWRRIKAGQMPAPIDHARQALFERDAMISALGRASRPESDRNAAMAMVESRPAQLAQRRSHRHSDRTGLV